MLGRMGRKIAGLRRCESGNTIMLVALGLPMLIGSAGLGVDVAQWYMWKRELQYAVDQAAIAGAWASTDQTTKSTFIKRAEQEFEANISTTIGTTTLQPARLANFAGGTNNSVMVSATTTQSLPFTSFLTGSATTVYAFAQASFAAGASFTSCLVATDEDESGAITISGSSVLTASCGLAALSTSDTAIVVDGTPTIDAGWIIAAGGIDPWLKTHTDDTIMENMSGLYDPFEELSPPTPAESLVDRTYQCIKGNKTTKANVSTTATTTYTYWKGADYNTAVATSYNKAKNKEVTYVGSTYTVVANDIVEGQVVSTTTIHWRAVNGTDKNTIWEKETIVSDATHTNVTSNTPPDTATVLPGTYQDIQIGCATTFKPGVYYISGGGLKITGQYNVLGAGVMFVLTNGAYVDITGGASVNLTAMQTSELIAKGVSPDAANKLAGMLIFEDRNSDGTSKNKINGNASTVLNGTIYLPNSPVDFAGTASVTSQCLMIAALQIKLTGTTNMTTFCPAGQSSSTTVVNTQGTVKLVA